METRMICWNIPLSQPPPLPYLNIDNGVKSNGSKISLKSFYIESRAYSRNSNKGLWNCPNLKKNIARFWRVIELKLFPFYCHHLRGNRKNFNSPTSFFLFKNSLAILSNDHKLFFSPSGIFFYPYPIPTLCQCSPSKATSTKAVSFSCERE